MIFSDEMRTLADWGAKEGDVYAFLFGRRGAVSLGQIYVVGKGRSLIKFGEGYVCNTYYGDWNTYRFWKKVSIQNTLEDML